MLTGLTNPYTPAGTVADAIARRLVLYARRPGHQSQFSPVLATEAMDETPARFVETCFAACTGSGRRHEKSPHRAGFVRHGLPA